MKRAPRRKPTNITLNAELVREARELGMNLSRELEEQLEKLVRLRRAEKWRDENRKAIDAYSKFFDQHGIWNEDERGW